MIPIMIRIFYAGNIVVVLQLLILFVHRGSGNEQLINQDYLSGITTCRSGNQSIRSIEMCDSFADCEDESDEDECENTAVLLYYSLEQFYATQETYRTHTACNFQIGNPFDHDSRCIPLQNRLLVKLNLLGEYLGKRRGEFEIELFETMQSGLSWELDGKSWSGVPFWKDIRIASVGRQIDVFYKDDQWDIFFANGSTGTGRQYVKRVSRAGFGATKKSEDFITSSGADWVTSTVYYIVNSTIKMCDKDLQICRPLSSKLIRNPVLLSVASKDRSLFWIEQKSPSKYQLFRYSLDQSAKTKLIKILFYHSSSPRWLTHDSARDRLYWMNVSESGASIFSSAFDGSNLKAISPIFINKTTSSFAVFNNTLYWLDNGRKMIRECSVTNCSHPTRFKDLSAMRNVTIDHLLMIDHRSWSVQREIQHPCRDSSCSHLCVPSSKYNYNCFCEDLDKPIPGFANNGYCEGNTLIAYYENNLLVVALPYARDLPDVNIRKNTLSVGSITKIAYGSRDGTITLTDTDEQNFHNWTPRGGRLSTTTLYGYRTIHSIEIDSYTNNLYWLDPDNFAIYVRNDLVETVLRGNASYSPLQFTLASSVGYLFVVFLKDDVTVVVERVPMYGLEGPRNVFYEEKDEETLPECISLHYMTKYDLLLLLDKKRNTIRYFSGDGEFQDLTPKIKGRLESVVSLERDIIWSEDHDSIMKARIDVERASSGRRIFKLTRVQRIPLNLRRTNESSPLKLLAIEKWTDLSYEKRDRLCLPANGSCPAEPDALCRMYRESELSPCSCVETADEWLSLHFCTYSDEDSFRVREGVGSGVDDIKKGGDINGVLVFCVSFALVHFMMQPY